MNDYDPNHYKRKPHPYGQVPNKAPFVPYGPKPPVCPCAHKHGKPEKLPPIKRPERPDDYYTHPPIIPSANDCNCTIPDRFPVSNIINVESQLLITLKVTLYGVREEDDVTVILEKGKQYTFTYITEQGVRQITGYLKYIDTNIPTDCIRYIGESNEVTDQSYIIVDASTTGNSDIVKIFIRSLRGIKEYHENPFLIGDTEYTSLAEAVEASSGETIKLTKDTESVGLIAKEGSKISIDLDGNKLTLAGQMVGSAGTETNGFQLLKGSEVTFKNGIISSEVAKVVIQNYSNLTLDNVTVECNPVNQYLVSNNFGNVVFKNGTRLKATGSTVPFDVYYGLNEAYDDGVTVTIEDDSVVISGNIEYGKAARASQEGLDTKCKLTVPLGYQLNEPDGYEWHDNGDNTQSLVRINTTEDTDSTVPDYSETN